ncbi:unnamed protein product [Citrullus colocynthis]|uniref:Uncharacterized protein n=1 Tax=Citrullus colocynthis TaxID=252529 RepID=A0ABP0YGV5_9ROSI
MAGFLERCREGWQPARAGFPVLVLVREFTPFLVSKTVSASETERERDCETSESKSSRRERERDNRQFYTADNIYIMIHSLSLVLLSLVSFSLILLVFNAIWISDYIHLRCQCKSDDFETQRHK